MRRGSRDSPDTSHAMAISQPHATGYLGDVMRDGHPELLPPRIAWICGLQSLNIESAAFSLPPLQKTHSPFERA